VDVSARAEVEWLADQHAALRRVATLVAREASQVELFHAVTEEAARVIETEAVGMLRFESDGTATLVAQSDTPWEPPPVGTRLPLDGENLVSDVVRTGQAARMDDWAQATGSIAAMADVLGVRSSVATPIVVEGRLWGVMIAATSQREPLPADTESRIEEFTELVATAIANAESRVAHARLAEEQAAIRRVAVLVANRATTEALAAAVVAEIVEVFGIPSAWLLRYESDLHVSVLASVNDSNSPVGARWPLDGPSLAASVLEARRPARIDDYSELSGTIAAVTRASGFQSAVGVPIIVDGAVWGMIGVGVRADEELTSDVEARLTDFTELVATAISNTDSRDHLHRLADEQAALRRVATLVAGNAPPMVVFAAVTEEVGRLFVGDWTYVTRFDSDDTVTVLAGWMLTGEPPVELPGRWSAGPTSEAIRAARAPVRLDPYPRRDEVEDPETAVVAAPITVAGALWGFITVASTTLERPPPPDTEARLSSFTELIATAIANAESRAALDLLAEEQAALRRVAALVAQQPSPDEVFTAVAEAVAPLLGADLTAMHAFSDDGTATVIAGWSGNGPMLPLGTLLPLDGDSAAARIFQTGAAARIDTYVEVEGETAGVARGLGLRSTVGAPIVVEGQLWGALMAATRGDEPLPDDAETRIAEFTELVATAVSNADSRAALGQLADEQASLRRVATLVARGVPSGVLFAAVTREVARVFSRIEPSVLATVIRFDPGPVNVMVGASRSYPSEAVGDSWAPKELYVSTRVLRTGASARIGEADLESLGGAEADVLRDRGFLHQVGSPVVVEGRLWGAMTLNSQTELPPDVDQRLTEFTELLATAIANAESQSELAASRSRMVAAADDARRRIERDLHDGIQQQLVSIGMELGAVEASLSEDDDLRAQVTAVSGDLRSAIDDLREISRGIHPAILAHGGLGAALKTLARRSAVPVQLTATMDGRIQERVEVATYYVVSEALTNVARHAGASMVSIDVARRHEALEIVVRDDGVGGADPGAGSGLIGLKDRVEALGGTISVDSPPGGGTSLVVALPLGSDDSLDAV
jgi:signal transduction histidine kinase/putative methionine-R-sulfoxide reductase with GAF domain